MNKVRAYYNAERGYELFMPDGQLIPELRSISIHDNWIETTNKTGKETLIRDVSTADVDLYVDVVNERPVCEPDYMNREIKKRVTEYGLKTGGISDGYHTFDELYAHRIELYIQLCSMFAYNAKYHHNGGPDVWRALRHSDGSIMEGWFVLGINKESGAQITYHLPLSRWEDCSFAETLDIAPEWDGHTSADVLKRLAEL